MSKYTNRITNEEISFIKENYLKYPLKTLSKIMGRSSCGIKGVMERNNLIIPKEIIEQRKKESQFKKGCTAHNKGKKQIDFMSKESIENTKATRFKKGSLPHNYKGGLYKTKEGYVMRSLGESKKILNHHYEWENKNGKIPKGYILKCKTKDITNCNPSNWILISMEENMFRNSKHDYPEEIIPSLVLNRKIETKIKSIQNG